MSGAYSTVGNQSYGTILRFDFPMFETNNDWIFFSTIYGAYIGSTQEYEESKIYQNGGYGGFLLSGFKDNFYFGSTINGGGLGTVSHYIGGKDDYATNSTGSALKLAYNFKFKRLIIQPDFTISYTFLNLIMLQ